MNSGNIREFSPKERNAELVSRQSENRENINVTKHYHSRLRDVMGQSYPIYACTRVIRARYSSVHVTFCRSLKHSLFK